MSPDMTVEMVERMRRRVREQPGSRAWRMMCALPLEKRHPSMRDLPYLPSPEYSIEAVRK
jgi:hypothetical protein